MNRRYILRLLSTVALSVAVAGCGGKSEAEQASDALDRGLKAHAAGQIDEAAADYREVLTHDPQNKFAFYNLGLIDQTAGRADAAEKNYRLALSADPNYEPALFNLAILRTSAGSTQEAIDLYRRATAADANEAGAHLNLGLLLRATGQQTEGDAEVKRAVELNPKLQPNAATSEQTPAPKPSLTPTRSP